MFSSVKSLFRQAGGRARPSHLELGERGERAALEYLRDHEGYHIVAINFRTPVGRGLRGQKVTAEIDIIAYDGDVLAFVEVKTRSSDERVAPERSVDLRKQRQIARAARRYRRMMRVSQELYRYDVVTVLGRAAGDRIELLRGYFDDGVFRRGRFFSDGE
ncbi:MAG TPA: YraN family protein [Blastocatellia bacterium]|nr:YraN family protein [Blastocatellia bacterium]